MNKETLLRKNNIMVNELKKDRPLLLKNIMRSIDEYAELYYQNKVKNLGLFSVSNNEERVAVSCSSCKWMQAKYDYKCDGCTQFQNYEQDTDC